MSYGGGGESAQASGVSVGLGAELSADPGSEVATTMLPLLLLLPLLPHPLPPHPQN